MPPLSSCYIFFVTIFALQFIPIYTTCPQYQYSTIVDGQATCVSQTVITASLRPTPLGLVFFLVFEGGQVPFTSLSDFNSNTIITLSSNVETITPSTQLYASTSIADDLSIIQIILGVTQVPYGTSMLVSFTDFSTVETRSSIMAGPVSMSLPSIEELSTTDSNLIDVLTTVDYVLEFVWIGMSLINPFWMLYMDCKLYRETLNMLKQSNAQYEPFLYTFYLFNDKKVSGVRVPNVFGIFVLGNNFASEWTKFPQNNIGLNYVNSDRITDIDVIVDPQLLRYNQFPLFLDNYGAQLTTLLGGLAIILFYELVFKIIRYKKTQENSTPILQKIRVIIWNFLLMNVLGSCQSLFFYTALQIQAFLSEKTLHNSISFGAAIASFLVAMVCTCGYIIWAARKKFRAEFFKSIEDQKESLVYFSPVLNFYKGWKLRYPLLILLTIARAIIFAVLFLALNSYPIIQAATMLGTTLAVTVCLIIFRPYKKIVYTIFKLVFEFILLLTLAVLLVLSIKDHNVDFSSTERAGLGVVFLILWIAVPAMTSIFGFVGLFLYAKQFLSGPRSVKVAPVGVRNGPVPDLVTKKKMEKYQTPVSNSGPIPSMSTIPPDTKRELLTNRNGNETEAFLISDKSQTNLPTPGYKADMSGLLNKPQNELQKPTLRPQLQERKIVQKRMENQVSVNKPKQEARPLLLKSNTIKQNPNQSMPGQLREHPRQNSERTLGRRRLPFEPVELKLTAESLRFIDEVGFKSFVSPKDPEEDL